MKGKHKYLFVVVDHFTKFVQIFPTKNKLGRSAADLLLNKYLLDFGFPNQIYTTRERNLTINCLRDCLWNFWDKLSKTTPYHPMGNGLWERMNQTLLNMLKTLPENFKNHWKSHIKTWHLHRITPKIKLQASQPFFFYLDDMDDYPWMISFWFARNKIQKKLPRIHRKLAKCNFSATYTS